MKKVNTQTGWTAVAIVGLVSLLGWSLASATRVEASPPDCIKVLFLGGDGHHDPGQRAQQVMPELARRGIQLTYVDAPEEALDADVLSQYDALVVYANHTYISPEQEQALLHYVARGGGFVPIHSASYCFLNSEAYIKLVGAQFRSHGTGVFTTRRVHPDHPAVEGVPHIESWDETYIHHKHNPDKTVLAVREEGGRDEPWTWVRRHGQGRVFYTAWGHDERTWSKPDFVELLDQGIRWAAGDWALELQPPEESFEYVETEVPLPSYPPENQWGVTGEPIRTIQRPLSPEASMQHMAMPPGFEVELFAAEPNVVNPIDMAWDERGRLWVAETVDYPNQIEKTEGVGDDRIRILEDTDGDGRADKFTVFADSLNLPTSLAFGNGGLIVTQPPHTLFLEDTDGDDRADVREVLFTGWGTFDTHATASNLTYGLDNQIWGTVGYSGFQGAVGGEDREFAQAVYRFAPAGDRMELMRRTNNNTWGLGISEQGHVFASTANDNPSVYVTVPHRYYAGVQGWEPQILNTIADNALFHPITETVRQVDQHGRYTAAASHEIYTARQFPKEYWDRAAFVNGPTGHLMGKFTLQPNGSGYRAHNSWNMLASRDTWTAPVDAEVGPDGALWMIDWYNLVIQHNPTPEGYETGEGNAYEIDLRDRSHGRIYRIYYDENELSDGMSLADAGPDELVGALRHDNMFWRRTAQRLLVERGETDILPSLYSLVEDETTNELGQSPWALHALWTLHGLGALDGSNEEALDVAMDALHHTAAAVRSAALQVLSPSTELREEIMSGGLLFDMEPQVRKQALLTASQVEPSEEIGEAVAQVALAPDNMLDPWIPEASIAAGARHQEGFLNAIMQTEELPDVQDTTYLANLKHVVSTVSRDYAATGSQEALSAVLALDETQTAAVREAVAEGMAAGWPEGDAPQLDQQDRDRLQSVWSGASDVEREHLTELSGKWGEPDLFAESE